MRVPGCVLALGAIALAAGACGSETDDRPANFSYVYTAVIEPNCTTVACHSDSAATFDIALDTLEGAYEVLVGSPCGDEPVPPLLTYVRPGDPQRSRLINLLIGTDVPRRMPPDVPLPSQDIELVERWILAGAECDG
jgi:hypothetical protein